MSQPGTKTARAAIGGAERTHRHGKQRGPIDRLLRLLKGRAKRKRRSKPRTADDRAIAWLWPHLTLTVGRRHPPRYENRDAIILQMGRVGSISIYEAIRSLGYNAYHSHGISDAHCLATLHRLQHNATRHAVLTHLAAVAHSGLLQWYQQHKTRNGARLKIVTLTRDPASWMSSNLVQRKQETLPRIRAWHAATTGRGADDDLAAMRAFSAALGEMILAAKPSRDLHAAILEIGRLAKMRWPATKQFASLAAESLSCATWFERETRPVLGLDLLADPRLRDSGAARVETDHAEILTLRFEDLPASAPLLCDFLGLGSFALPHSNATAHGEDRVALRAAFDAGMEQAGGAAVRRELRATLYGRACGYDRLPD
jgi:hypothetical protein